MRAVLDMSAHGCGAAGAGGAVCQAKTAWPQAGGVASAPRGWKRRVLAAARAASSAPGRPQLPKREAATTRPEESTASCTTELLRRMGLAQLARVAGGETTGRAARSPSRRSEDCVLAWIGLRKPGL